MDYPADAECGATLFFRPSAPPVAGYLHDITSHYAIAYVQYQSQSLTKSSPRVLLVPPYPMLLLSRAQGPYNTESNKLFLDWSLSLP